MPDLVFNRVCRIVLGLLVLLPCSAIAQSEELYRVELLVFSYPAGGAGEQWNATPELAYPRNSQFIIYPGEQSSPQVPQADGLVSTLPEISIFTALPSEQRELEAKAAAMQRSGRYKILFHEAWTQPITGKSAAVPVVLDRSGDGGPWPALQGTIKLYLSRYFYLDTNLWLNTQGEYLPGAWRMPAPPRGPASQQQLPSETLAPASAEASTAAVQTTYESTATLDRVPTADSVSSDYPFRHAVLLKQSRRMRSGQLNYIDHPMLGVLIKVSPLNEPEATPDSSSSS